MAAPSTQASWNLVSNRAKLTPPVGVGGVALHQGVERLLGRARGRAQQEAEQHRARPTPPSTAATMPPTMVTASEPDDDARLGEGQAQAGRQRRRRPARRPGRPPPRRPASRRGRSPFLNAKATIRTSRPDRAAQQGHGRRGQPDAGAAQLLLLDRAAGSSAATWTRGSRVANPTPIGEDDRAHADRQLRAVLVAAELQQEQTGATGHDGGHAAQQGQLRVGLDQLAVAAHGGRHDRGARDQVGLREHQHEEGLEVEGHDVEVAHDEHAQHGPEAEAADDHPPAPALAPGRAPAR